MSELFRRMGGNLRSGACRTASGRGAIWSVMSCVMRVPPGDHARCWSLDSVPGANIAFFSGLGVEYFGTEGSESAVRQVSRRFADQPRITLACCDFTRTIPFDGPFDLVVDRSSLTHNSTADIRRCLLTVGSRMNRARNSSESTGFRPTIRNFWLGGTAATIIHVRTSSQDNSKMSGPSISRIRGI